MGIVVVTTFAAKAAGGLINAMMRSDKVAVDDR
jgi:hypothetical protein